MRIVMELAWPEVALTRSLYSVWFSNFDLGFCLDIILSRTNQKQTRLNPQPITMLFLFFLYFKGANNGEWKEEPKKDKDCHEIYVLSNCPLKNFLFLFAM